MPTTFAECLDGSARADSASAEPLSPDDGSEDSTGFLKSYGRQIRYIRKENGGKPGRSLDCP
jgi:hypothetical protein